jgi:Zn-dependent protease
MNNWWVLDQWNAHKVLPIATVVWVIGSVVLHELAHGWAALAFGDRTPRETGHMTANPLVHMGQTSLILFALIGIAWGQMPVNPSRMRGRFAPVIVALAGPAMNLALFGITVVLTAVWIGFVRGAWGVTPIENPLAENLLVFLTRGVELNILLGLFNLLPVPPLDGFRILTGLIPPLERLWQREQAQIAAVILFVLLFMFGGKIIYPIANRATLLSIDGVATLIGAYKAVP